MLRGVAGLVPNRGMVALVMHSEPPPFRLRIAAVEQFIDADPPGQESPACVPDANRRHDAKIRRSRADAV